MTPLETLIEEKKKEFNVKQIGIPGMGIIGEKIAVLELTLAMQRAYEAGRISWLRSEIERVEGMKRNLNPRGQEFQELHEQYNQAIDDIITPWKKELAELEKNI